MAVNLDGNTIYALLKGGPEAVAEALSVGIKPDNLDGKAAKAFAEIVQHAMEYQSVPSFDDIASVYGSEVVVETGLARAFVFQEIGRRSLYRNIALGIEEVDKRLKSNDPEGAMQALAEAHAAALARAPKKSAPTSMFALGNAVVDNYDLMLKGGIAIPAPWPSINAMTMGWTPGTNSWFAARPGSGKTWLALLSAKHAWAQRHNKENPRNIKTLIISPEMLKVALAERFFVEHAKLSYSDVVGTSLSKFQHEKLLSVVKELSDETGIWVIDATDKITPERIMQAVDELEIDLLVIDAAYKIKRDSKARNRFDNLFAGVEMISEWAKRGWKNDRRIAVVADSQLNRAGTKGGKQKSNEPPGQEALAMADNIAWEADNLMLVERGTDDSYDGVVHLYTSKVRRMAEYKPKITLRMNMQTMDFSEVEVGNKPKFKDPDYSDDSPF